MKSDMVRAVFMYITYTIILRNIKRTHHTLFCTQKVFPTIISYMYHIMCLYVHSCYVLIFDALLYYEYIVLLLRENRLYTQLYVP